MIEFLINLPKEAWIVLSGFSGALVGGVITLFATFIQNRSETKRLTAKLSHDATARREERHLSMRREIYYNAIDSIASHVNFLSNLPQADLRNGFPSSNELTANVQRLQLVAGEALINAFENYSALTSQCIFSLTPHKMAIQGLEIDKEHTVSMEKLVAEYQKENVQKMEDLNKRGIQDQQHWDLLNAAAAKYSEDRNKYIEEISTLDEKIIAEKMTFLRSVIPWLTDVGVAANKVIIEMRKELESTTDDKIITALQSSIERTNTRNIELVNDFLAKLDVLIAES